MEKLYHKICADAIFTCTDYLVTDAKLKSLVGDEISAADLDILKIHLVRERYASQDTNLLKFKSNAASRNTFVFASSSRPAARGLPIDDARRLCAPGWRRPLGRNSFSLCQAPAIGGALHPHARGWGGGLRMGAEGWVMGQG